MLEYKGIKLKPIETEDVTILNKWKNDEEVFKYLGGGFRPISESQQKKWMESMIENNSTNQRFMIISEDNKKIGFIGLYSISEIHRTCTLGIYIGEKKYWGKGIASRAYSALEDYARRYLNIRKIRLEVVRDNEGAVNLYKKLQFEMCGVFKKDRFIDGEYRDIILMEKFIG